MLAIADLASVGRRTEPLAPIFTTKSETSTYDSDNRLLKINGNPVIQYTYDTAGNRTSRVVSKPTQLLSPNTGPDQTVQKDDLASPDFLPEEHDAADVVPR